MRLLKISFTILAFFSLFGGASYASDYPNKPVTILAPVAAGGGLDLVARTVAERLTKSLGQNFLVDNQSGGGGIIASQKAARATPDGYTLMLSYVGTHGTNPAVRKIPYDPIKDFSPIAMVGGTPNVLVVYSPLPIKNFKEFIQYAKDNSAKMSYGSAGPGTLTHLSMEQLKQQANFESTHVPYRGIAPAFIDTIAGQTLSMMPGLAAAMPHIKTGKVRPIAVTGLKRHPLIPDVPTFKELGLEGFEGVQWYGISGPANLPPAIITLLNSEINKAIQNPELKERLAGEAIQAMPMTPEQFGQYIKDDIARWSKIAKSRNIQID
ncbi:MULTISPECIES: tripartite tricarboxylate transporter substrate binding protein [unclassified Polynucleobacter]|uniref:Bug family tripartite tricarboxylate transporter substrate binding protein n=1 Tax=unclassified Polynucleobacter TaxID=2640945 RepID=UPI002490CAFA|nr:MULTISPECIES: tripartite tricarboxylate transporter substrate binding protein [unclassified Polynucleobacter]